MHRTDARRWSRKTIQRGIDPPAFYFVPLAGPLVHWVSGVTGPGLVVLSAAGALTVIGVGVQVIPYAKPPT